MKRSSWVPYSEYCSLKLNHIIFNMAVPTGWVCVATSGTWRSCPHTWHCVTKGDVGATLALWMCDKTTVFPFCYVMACEGMTDGWERSDIQREPSLYHLCGIIWGKPNVKNYWDSVMFSLKLHSIIVFSEFIGKMREEGPIAFSIPFHGIHATCMIKPDEHRNMTGWLKYLQIFYPH